MPAKRHLVTVMRPAEATDEYGQTQGQPATILKDVPCSIEPLSGRETELARQTFGIASLRVRMYGDPAKPLQYTDWLAFGGRRLNIGQIIDRHQNGLDLELICGEAT